MSVALLVFAIAVVMIVCERLGSGRQWKRISGWWSRAMALNLVQAGVVYLAGISWDHWMIGTSLWQIEPIIGKNPAAFLGYFTITFVFYWWHRLRHQVDFLWKWFHQIHHSPQRIEVIMAFYKHPFEIAANSLITSVILFIILGLSPEAASQAILLSGLAELFYHWNVKTPYWLGFSLPTS
jgi:sterol desaturase/sphingolipid hydroxylase (fatty acid hydroxylase superfamily)